MTKEFNITGSCSPHRHYMADTSKKLGNTLDLIHRGAYFIINRPRQYGKTTAIYQLTEILRNQEEYLPILLSFENMGDLIFQSEALFCQTFVEKLRRETDKLNMAVLVAWVSNAKEDVIGMDKLAVFIEDFVCKVDKKVVIFIDEVDKSSNNQLFLHFLGVLRNSFLMRDQVPAFHSVVLAGVHDVKNLKLKLRPDEEQKYNSPWNIAADYKVDMNLYPDEIEPMLADYCQERGVTMDIAAIAEKLFYYTSGYPFLVSKLCKMLDEQIMPEKNTLTWEVEDIETVLKEMKYEK
jgi:AAA-like domain